MLASSIKLCFSLHHKKRNLRVVRLCAGSIPFSSDLLGKKLKGSSDGLVAIELFAELREMALESCKFFCDVASLGEDCDLGDNARI